MSGGLQLMIINFGARLLLRMFTPIWFFSLLCSA